MLIQGRNSIPALLGVAQRKVEGLLKYNNEENGLGLQALHHGHFSMSPSGE
jgi:hypothetical protein